MTVTQKMHHGENYYIYCIPTYMNLYIIYMLYMKYVFPQETDFTWKYGGFGFECCIKFVRNRTEAITSEAGRERVSATFLLMLLKQPHGAVGGRQWGGTATCSEIAFVPPVVH